MDNEGSTTEQGYGQQLRSARLEEEKKNSSLETEVEEMEGAPPKDYTVIFVLALLVALISDFIDFLVIGAIPVIGDILDVITGATLTILLWDVGGRRKNTGLAALSSPLISQLPTRLLPIAALIFELLPLGINDLMPTYTVEVIMTWYRASKK